MLNENSKMVGNIRELLPLTEEEIKTIVLKELKNDYVIAVDEKGNIYKHLFSTIVKPNGEIWGVKKVGYGKVEYYAHVDDVAEVYEHYRDVLYPFFNADKTSKEEREYLEKIKDNQDEINKFANTHSDKILKITDTLEREGKKIKFMLYSEYLMKKYKEEQEEKLKNLHVTIEYSSGNLMPYGQHYVLSERISQRAWEKIKHYFRYFDSSEFNDEVWGPIFRGYEIIPEKVEELEEILEIPQELRLKYRLEQEKIQKQKIEQEQKEKEEFLKKIIEEFSPQNAIDISEEIKKAQTTRKFIKLEGEKIWFTGKDTYAYGGGQWFVITEDAIWYVINNGHDGDDWSINFIGTGGAGAIGYKFEKTPERIQLLRKLKEIVEQ